MRKLRGHPKTIDWMWLTLGVLLVFVGFVGCVISSK